MMKNTSKIITYLSVCLNSKTFQSTNVVQEVWLLLLSPSGEKNRETAEICCLLKAALIDLLAKGAQKTSTQADRCTSVPQGDATPLKVLHRIRTFSKMSEWELICTYCSFQCKPIFIASYITELPLLFKPASSHLHFEFEQEKPT